MKNKERKKIPHWTFGFQNGNRCRFQQVNQFEMTLSKRKCVRSLPIELNDFACAPQMLTPFETKQINKI